MRTLVLSVCVGLCLSACDGAVEKSEENVEAGDGGDSSRRDSSVTSGEDDSGSTSQEPRDSGSTTREPDSGNTMTATDGGTRDSGTRDAGASDAGTRDAGRDSGMAAQDSGPSNPPDSGVVPTGKPVFVVAGYQSAIAVSTDLGLSWRVVREPRGPRDSDDENVLSGCAFGKGAFVVGGWHLFSSPDGETWTERTNPSTQWLGNITFGNGVFAGAGGYGTTLYSSDGISWNLGKMLTPGNYDRGAFGAGTFMVSERGGTWWRSTDGNNWERNGTNGTTADLVWCNDHFADDKDCSPLVPNGQTAFGAGVWVRVQHNATIQRSTNGTQWTDVGTRFDVNCVAIGYVP